MGLENAAMHRWEEYSFPAGVHQMKYDRVWIKMKYYVNDHSEAISKKEI
jgi:hypothetical protein